MSSSMKYQNDREIIDDDGTEINEKKNDDCNEDER